MSDLIQIEYERIAQLAVRFNEQADIHQTIQRDLITQAAALSEGGWEGAGAQAFTAEMSQEIAPAYDRLIIALQQAQQTTLQISSLLQTADEEAAAPFQQGAPTTTTATPGATSWPEPTRPIAPYGPGPNSWRPTAEAVTGLFSQENMDDMVGYYPPIAYPQEMADAMKNLFRIPPLDANSAETQALLTQMAEAYGSDITPEYMTEQYERYTELFHEAHPNGGGPAVPYDTSIPISQLATPLVMAGVMNSDTAQTLSENFDYANFWGSTWQMRTGTVTGNALGVDPIFGAMLNPTGGLVGKQAMGFMPLDEDAIGYHGAFHDAAGYLYNYHQIGPGYNYLGQEARDTSQPETGQETGIAYWQHKVGTTSGPLASASTVIGTQLGMLNELQVSDVVPYWDEFTSLFDF